MNHSILYIEDEKKIREQYESNLHPFFDTVYTAVDGVDGYEKYKKYKPDILLIDINLPKLSGIDLLKKIREKDHTTKAIMLTAHYSVDFLLSVASLKLTSYLIKPVSRTDFKEAIAAVIKELSEFETRAKNILVLKDNFLWNYESKELCKDLKKVSLTPNETLMLELFFLNLNANVSYDELSLHLYNDESSDKVNSVKIILKKLRKKLPVGLIENIYAVGYKLNLK